MESTEVKLYTVSDIRNWLVHNQAPEGLTSEVIRPDMAWALIHHPDVLDDDPIVACIYDNGVLTASTCAFPEILVKPTFTDEHGKQKRIWWYPMLWVKPEYRGKGYGLVAIGSLAEIYGVDCSWTAWAVPEAIEVFEYLGCKTYYFPRFFMGDKHIRSNSIKGKLAVIKQLLHKRWNSLLKPALPHYDFELRYLSNVDDECYAFICGHSLDKPILSSQAVLNWEMHYPWSISSPLVERCKKTGEYFADITPRLQHLFVQVRNNGMIIGVYRLRIYETGIACDNLYYVSASKDIVFATVVEHLKIMHVSYFDTEDRGLAEFVQRYIYFPKSKEESISLNLSPLVDIITCETIH